MITTGTPMHQRCPHCGLSPDLAKPQIDYGTSELVFEGRRCRLTDSELAFVEILLHHYPRPVSRYLILDEMYGDEDRCRQLLSVVISHIRQKFRASGVRLNFSCNYQRYERNCIGLVPTAQPPARIGVPYATVRRQIAG
jgi:hypothetical protein